MAGDAASGGAEPENRPLQRRVQPCCISTYAQRNRGEPQEPRLPVPWECHSPRQLPGTACAPQCVIRDPITNKGGFRD